MNCGFSTVRLVGVSLLACGCGGTSGSADSGSSYLDFSLWDASEVEDGGTCGAEQTVCEALCCDNATETCDGNGNCVVNPCDPLQQTGCTTGQSCYPDWFGDGIYICGTTGTVAVGGACGTYSDCVTGAACLPTTQGVAVCIKLCDSSASDSCAGGENCQDLDGTVGKCPCNPLGESSGCSPGQTCYPDFLSTGGYHCATTGTLAVGAACDASGACVAGATCVPSDGAGICAALCDPAAPTNTCAGSETCDDYDGTVGVCAGGTGSDAAVTPIDAAAIPDAAVVDAATD